MVNRLLTERPASSWERLTEAAIAYFEAEDSEWDRARDNLRKSAVAYAKLGTVIRDAMERAKQSGVHVGRPRKVTLEIARAAVAEVGSIRRAAMRLGVHEDTVRRALRTAQH